jgi:hypothetical protein
MKIIQLFFFCLFTNLGFGQLLFLNNSTNQGTCDGSVIFNGHGWELISHVPQAGYVTWKKIEGNDTIIIQEGGWEINNLCPGDYILNSMEIDADGASEIKFSIKNNSTILCESFSVSEAVFQTNEISAFFDENQALVNSVILESYYGTEPYNFYFDNTLILSNYNVYNHMFYSTDLGFHTMKITDANGCSDSLNFEIRSFDKCRVFLALSPLITDETVTNACDGSLIFQPTNIVDSLSNLDAYHLTWDNGQTGLTLSDLCPGKYLCNIVVDTSFTQSCQSQLFIIIEDALDSVYVYGGFENTMNVLYSEWTDECSINLTAIQSAEIIDFTFITSDSILVTWEVRDTNQVVATIYAGYSIPNTSENYNFVLQLYCLQKSFPVYAHAVDQYYIGELSVSTSTLEGVSIAPNPAENILKVKSKVDFETFVISDMRGKTVKSQNYSSEINIEDLQSGIYLLHLHHDENVVLVKFAKR